MSPLSVMFPDSATSLSSLPSLFSWTALGAVAIIVPLLVAVALLTWFERKVLAAMQLRRGPNVTGPFGLLQPLADGIKLMTKETIVPANANRFLFLLAPVFTLAVALAAWAVIPFDAHLVFADINVGLLYLFAMSSLGVYGVILAGWASNSRYAFLGALRSTAQMVSYEISIGFIFVTVLLLAGSLNLSEIVLAQEDGWFLWPLFPMFVAFFIAALAETNRAPFDLPEAEAELVAGYNVEYTSMGFALFFLGEYANMILMSAMAAILFLGGWLPPVSGAVAAYVPGVVWLLVKIAALLFLFVWVRASFPRYRYDQLMRLGWKVLLPLTLVWLVATAAFVVLRESPA